MRDRQLTVVLGLILFSSTLFAQENHSVSFDTTMYRPGYDIPAGVPHGTWDFDEWPGVDHDAIYKKHFMYNESPSDKYKIDYSQTVFDPDDYEGYLRSPSTLIAHGFKNVEDILSSDTHKTIIGIFTHPDDEVLLAGGLFAEAARLGWLAQIYLASNGADGLAGSSTVPDSSLGGYNSYGVMTDGSIRILTDSSALVKARVVQTYSEKLHVPVSILRFNLIIDGKRLVELGEEPGLDWEKSFGPGTKAREAIYIAVTSLLQKENPDVLVTHGSDGEYGNYLHKTVHDIVLEAARDIQFKGIVFTAFPEYNFQDHITHFLDLDTNNKYARTAKFQAFQAISFLHTPGMDYDKPWDPTDSLMDGAFVKDYGYTPVEGYPPRYEFFQQVDLSQ